jgi:hypothetical protein
MRPIFAALSLNIRTVRDVDHRTGDNFAARSPVCAGLSARALVTNSDGPRTFGASVALDGTLVTDIRPHPEFVAPASAGVRPSARVSIGGKPEPGGQTFHGVRPSPALGGEPGRRRRIFHALPRGRHRQPRCRLFQALNRDGLECQRIHACVRHVASGIGALWPDHQTVRRGSDGNSRIAHSRIRVRHQAAIP